jgi:hypothetical protein
MVSYDSQCQDTNEDLPELIRVLGGPDKFTKLMSCVENFTATEHSIAAFRKQYGNNLEAAKNAVKYLKTCPYFFERFIRSVPSNHYTLGEEMLLKTWCVEKFRSLKPNIDIDKIL